MPRRAHIEDMEQRDKALLLFDGVCNVCNATVLFVIDRDPHERFVFAPLQSELGQRVLRENKLSFETDPGIVLVDGAKTYGHSTAALRVALGLRWPWPLLYYLFIAIPPVIRDAVYRYFGRHRYAWFGQSDQCRIPTPELRRRFVA